MSRPRLSQALGIGILFGVVEATTPLLGWLLGSAASRFVASIDHWVAFVLLAGLGIHMVWKSFQPLEPECDDQSDTTQGCSWARMAVPCGQDVCCRPACCRCC